jgi:hypothetical protein
MFDWIRALFGRSRSLRDDQISTTQSSVYASGGALDDDTSQADSSASDYSGGSDSGGSGSSGGGDSGGGGGNGG